MSVLVIISGILFDFDGVLSSIIVRLGWPYYHALKKVKPSIKKEEILFSLNETIKMYLKGHKRTPFYVLNMVYKISKTLQLNLKQTFKFIVYLLILIKKNNNNVTPEEGADRVLHYVTKHYKTGLVTHAEREVIQQAQKKFKYLKNIDVLITQQDLQFAKPHPDGLFKAMKALHLNPKETIFVGDLPHDIEAGKNAGTMTCAVVNFKGAEKGKRFLLNQFKPDFIINHIKELPKLLMNIEKSNY